MRGVAGRGWTNRLPGCQSAHLAWPGLVMAGKWSSKNNGQKTLRCDGKDWVFSLTKEGCNTVGVVPV